MGRLIKVCLIDMLIMSTALAGILFNDRFLDLYQFVMWTLVFLGFIGLIVPSKDMFKDESNGYIKNCVNWFFTICKILVSVWVGMVFLAIFYLIISLFVYGKKQSYFDDLKVKANENTQADKC